MNSRIGLWSCAVLATTLAGCRRAGTTDATVLWSRGVAHQQHGEYDLAITDFDSAIALRHDFASAYNSRGFARQLRGDYAAARVDYDSAIRLRPDRSTALINRGRDEFYLGDFTAAAADLTHGLSFDSANVYTAIWAHLAVRRSGADDSAAFAAAIARLPVSRWPGLVARFYLDSLDADHLMAAAADPDSATQNDQRCAADFYIGESLLWQRRTADARTHFAATAASCPKRYSEYHGAVTELARLASP